MGILVVLGGLIGAPGAGASHVSPSMLTPIMITSNGWANPDNALASADTYATATSSGAALTYAAFTSFVVPGTVLGVTFHVEQSQSGHLDDQFDVTAGGGGACGSVSANPSSVVATGSPTVRSVDLTCSAGWTAARASAVQVTLTTRTILLLRDGDWRIHRAWLEVAYSNSAPIANAGPDQSVNEGLTVTLDATSSSDSDDGDAITYAWAQTSGIGVALAAAQTAQPTFAAPVLAKNEARVLGFRVTVTDMAGHTGTDTVTVVVNNVNQAPTADAGPDLSAAAGAQVTLDGSGSSDPDQDDLTYAWAQTGGPPVTLSASTTMTPAFTSPTGPATLTFALTVADTLGAESPPDEVVITAPAAASSPSPSPTSSSAAPTSSGASSTSPTAPTSPTAAMSSSPTASSGLRELQIMPGTVVLAPGQEQTFRVRALDGSGAPVGLPAGTCAWRVSGNAGALVPGSSSGNCEAVFHAGGDPGTGSQVHAEFTSATGARFADRALVEVGWTAASDNASDPTCRAELPEVPNESVPLALAPGCGLEAVRLRLPAESRARIFEVERMAARPDGVPAWPANLPPEALLNVRLLDDEGSDVRTVAIELLFSVDPGWRATWCPEATCRVQLYHLENDAWTTVALTAIAAEDDNEAYEATADHLSYFVVAGVPVAPVQGAGVPAWLWWLIPSFLFVGATGTGLVVRARRRNPESEKPAPGPTAAVQGPAARSLVDELRNEELVRFLNTASHDLASPLTPIKLQLHLLQNADPQALSPAQRKGLEMIQRNIEHMGMLVTDLKDASRLQAGKLDVYPEPGDLATLAQRAAETFQAQGFDAGVTVDLVRGATDLSVRADEGRINQVLYNLLTNALKFTPKGGHVRVRAGREGNDAVVRVMDTGLGLSPEDIDKLFRPFSQVHGVKQKKKGSGLGLYICKGLIEAHGGRLWCESAGPGKGSTFAFALPLCAQDSASAEAAPSPAQAGIPPIARLR